jgi:hypothetical protein
MNARQALGRGGFVAAACVACCAPPIIAALGVTAGLAATAGIFIGIAAAVAVVLVGGTWILARTRRASPGGDAAPVRMPMPIRRDALGHETSDRSGESPRSAPIADNLSG